MKKIIITLLISLSLITSASALTTLAAQEKLKASFAATKFTNFTESKIKSWFEVEIANQVVYFWPKQELLFFGEIYNKNGENLSISTKTKFAKKRISKLNASSEINSAIKIGDGPVEITEFIDTDCPYCILMNKFMNKHKDLFTRNIIFFPITELHPVAYKEAIHILCLDNENQAQALTDAMDSKIASKDMITCAKGQEILKQHAKISKEFGVSATPTFILNGNVLQGFQEEKIKSILEKAGFWL
jgi:thiol:disulfide interchange protein DsbC